MFWIFLFIVGVEIYVRRLNKVCLLSFGFDTGVYNKTLLEVESQFCAFLFLPNF